MNKVEFEKVKGYVATVELPEDLNEYAKSFLAIHNNKREYRGIIKITNYATGNLVRVYYTDECPLDVPNWLAFYGEVKDVREITVYLPYISSDEIGSAFDRSIDSGEEFEIATPDWGWG